MTDEERVFDKKAVYTLGEDFTKEEYDKWLAQIALWISKTQTREENPYEKARTVIDAAINGTRLNGDIWTNVEDFTLDSRIMQLCSFNILTGTGRRRKTPKNTRSKARELRKKSSESKQLNVSLLEEINLENLIEFREEHKDILLTEFPFLDNPVYDIKVNAYCDTVAKLQAISEEFLGSEGKKLESLLKIRESLKKDIDDYMKMLKIHPSQIKDKVDEGDSGDVGSLISRWEEQGELAKLYEEVDAIQEAIQIIRQLEQVRLDGSPQLADWLLWHKTGCRGHKFICRCGEEYNLHGGFTKEDMYAILEQAYETFGYGLKRLDESKSEEISTETEET